MAVLGSQPSPTSGWKTAEVGHHYSMRAFCTHVPNKHWAPLTIHSWILVAAAYAPSSRPNLLQSKRLQERGQSALKPCPLLTFVVCVPPIPRCPSQVQPLARRSRHATATLAMQNARVRMTWKQHSVEGKTANHGSGAPDDRNRTPANAQEGLWCTGPISQMRCV
jgi:hypothetical protein